MYFTNGKLREFEKIMQEKPHYPNTINTPNEKHKRKKKANDCRYCLHFNRKKRKCNEKSCIVFDENGFEI